MYQSNEKEMYFYYLLSNGFLFHFFVCLFALYLWWGIRIGKVICENSLIYNPFVTHTLFYCMSRAWVNMNNRVLFKSHSSKLGNWKSLYFFFPLFGVRVWVRGEEHVTKPHFALILFIYTHKKFTHVLLLVWEKWSAN